MDDNLYYKIRTMEADLRWMSENAKKEGFTSMVNDEKKRMAIRKLLAEVASHVQTIQSSMGDVVAGEFSNVEVQ